MAFPIVSYGFTAHQYLFQAGLCLWLGSLGGGVGKQAARLCWLLPSCGMLLMAHAPTASVRLLTCP